ncbi:DUF72 domain-containing protein [Hyperthermus butylicus]|uniref:DUF72 protein n=1 Tax=Hyperthermus butylicus (strain DSM 5456 / JCM 9403 / PLM1-5) TaxID=415426 RepID=A2BKS6_HYPBU|nr:DUF72 protein [Hyperthermus butylicus DSM 5456]
MPQIGIYVGTSGWLYDWNLEGSLDWYVRHSGLNAVELNASFYRFPFPSQVASWARRGRELRWAVKVHRRITHVHRLNPNALGVWERFHKLFKPLDSLVDFYLFQLPPSYRATSENIERLERFAAEAGLGERMAVEFRHESWFENGLGVEVCRRIGATFVSVDSPIGVYIAASNDTVYLRMHGRVLWYAHNYTDEELLEDAKRVLALNPRRIYVFFNNDHDMLENARRMLKLLVELAKQS